MAQRPSQFLKSLSSSHEQRHFQEILQKHLYPFLDRLPANEQKHLLAVLSNASGVYQGAQLIKYESRSEAISKKLVALEKHVKAHWKHGWEDQVCRHPQASIIRQVLKLSYYMIYLSG